MHIRAQHLILSRKRIKKCYESIEKIEAETKATALLEACGHQI